MHFLIRGKVPTREAKDTIKKKRKTAAAASTSTQTIDISTQNSNSKTKHYKCSPLGNKSSPMMMPSFEVDNAPGSNLKKIELGKKPRYFREQKTKPNKTTVISRNSHNTFDM